MRKSEIFESFIKIAQDKGIISKDAPEKAIKQLSKTHRHDSLSADDIAKLYGVKSDRPKSMDYDRNIIEDAHPDTVVVSPSYDKLNGLLGNQNQKQDIALNKINKTPNGQLDAHKWAQKNLLLTLVRVGNDLDNKNKEELRALSDACLNQVSDPLKKEAWVYVTVGVVALFTALYAQQHLDDSNNSLKETTQNLVGEIDDLITSNSNFGLGYTFKPEFIQEMELFKSKVIELSDVASNAEQVIAMIEKPRDTSEINASIKQQAGKIDNAAKAHNDLRAKITQFNPFFKKVLKNFSDNSFKQRQIEETGVITKTIDKLKIFHGGRGLIKDDFDDVRGALPAFRNAYMDLIKILRATKSYEKSLQSELDLNKPEAPTEVTQEQPNAPTNPENEAAVAQLAKQVPTIPE